jgi:hypothetical protein
MAGMQNKIKLPPGLSIPAALQQKLQQANDASRPYRPVAANQYGPSVKTVARGSLVYFNYLFWIHDPYPLVLIADIYGQYIRGLNLHYLTFPYIKHVLQPGCDNRQFSYRNIRNNGIAYEQEYIPKAFRTYKRSGIRQLKVLDCSFILNVLASTRGIDPVEVDHMREVIRQQIQQQMRARQPQAAKMGTKYTGMVEGESQQGYANPIPGPMNPAPPE